MGNGHMGPPREQTDRQTDMAATMSIFQLLLLIMSFVQLIRKMNQEPRGSGFDFYFSTQCFAEFVKFTKMKKGERNIWIYM